MKPRRPTISVSAGVIAAPAAACFFALALDRGNKDLATLAVLGAVGDHQMTEGHCEGLNALLLETAGRRGDLRPDRAADGADWLFPRFGDRNYGRRTNGSSLWQ